MTSVGVVVGVRLEAEMVGVVFSGCPVRGKGLVEKLMWGEIGAKRGTNLPPGGTMVEDLSKRGKDWRKRKLDVGNFRYFHLRLVVVAVAAVVDGIVQRL